MRISILTKFNLFLLIGLVVANPILFNRSYAQERDDLQESVDEQSDEQYQGDGDGDDIDAYDQTENEWPEGFVPDDPYDGDSLDSSIIALNQWVYDATVGDNAWKTENPSEKTASWFSSDRIELNQSDRRDVDRLTKLYSVIPELDYPWNLALFSNYSEEELSKMDPTDYEAERERIQSTFDNNKIIEMALADPTLLSNILGESRETIINNLQNDNGKNRVIKKLRDILDAQIDRRVIETLNYLLRPKDDPRGGAGHWKIKVYRLRNGYKYENQKNSKESEAAYKSKSDLEEQSESTIEELTSKENLTDLDKELEKNGLDPAKDILVSGSVENTDGTMSDFVIPDDNQDANISAHYKGMAVDISEVDDIKCTVITKKLFSKKKKAEAPVPIKLLWQTEGGFDQDEGNISSSLNKMMLNMSQDALLDMLEGLNIDFENMGDMEGADFSDIVSLIGQAFFANAINSPNGEFWNMDLGTLLKKLGGVIMADNLSLERAPFIDDKIDSVDDITENLGRYNVEKRLNIPYGSLRGMTREQMFEEIGQQRLLYELKLPTDLFDYSFASEEDLYERIGSRIVENVMSAPAGSFYQKDTLLEIKNEVGRIKYKSIFASPYSLDQYFDLSDGTSKKFTNGKISPRTYVKAVAEVHMNQVLFNYRNYEHDSAATNTVTAIGKYSNWRDEMINTPEGLADNFIENKASNTDYIYAGKMAIAYALENNDIGRQRLLKWFENPNKEYVVVDNYRDNEAGDTSDTSGLIAINKDSYISSLNITGMDFYWIFGTDDASGVFKRSGEEILFNAFKKSSAYRKILDSNPTLKENVETFEFYNSRIKTIREHSGRVNRATEDLRSAIESSEELNDSTKSKILTSLDGLNNQIQKSNNLSLEEQFLDFSEDLMPLVYDNYVNISELAKIYAKSSDDNSRNITNRINALNYEVETVAKAAMEIINGREMPYFRLGDMTLSDVSSGPLSSLSEYGLGTSEVALLLSGKVKPKDLFLSVGSKKLSRELGLPDQALQYASIVISQLIRNNEDSRDAFFRAIGIAKVEDQAGVSNSPMHDQENASELKNGLTFKQLRQILARSGAVSRGRADDILLDGFNLSGYNINNLMRGDFGTWSKARASAEKNDRNNGLEVGTTESYIRGIPLAKYDNLTLNDDQIRELSTKFGVSETAIKTFIAKKNGVDNPAINQVYYVDNNKYSRSSDFAGTCSSAPEPNESYYYYDQDGLHTFSSYATANEYAKDNQDKKLDYLDEMSIAFSAAIIDSEETIAGENGQQTTYRSNYQTANLKSDLEKLLNGSSTSVFGNEAEDYSNGTYTFSTPELLARKYNVDAESINALFSKSGADGEAESVDMLKLLGKSLLESFASDYLGDYLNIGYGSYRLTGDDIYDVLNGRSRDAFAKIGGHMLEEELGSSDGTIQNILLSRNSDERKCNIQRAAISMIGDALGIKNLKLDGIVFNNMGGGKIEQYLGFPSGSFRGGSIQAMISADNGIRAEDFARAFKIPYSRQTTESTDSMLKYIGDEYYNANKGKNIYEKVFAVTSYVEALDGQKEEKAELWSRYESFRANVVQDINSLLSDIGGWASGLEFETADNSTLKTISVMSGYSDNDINYLWNQLKYRAKSLDQAFNISSGATENLLRGKASPDQYRDAVADKVINDLAYDVGGQLLINHFNLQDNGITTGRIKQFAEAIKSTSDSGSQATIYSFLSDLFSYNLDEKAGFSRGTIEKVIRYPDQSFSIMLREGARMLDAQIGRVDSNGIPYSGSFSGFIDIYLDGSAEDQRYCQEQVNQATTPGLPTSFDSSSYNRCINERRKGRTAATTDYVTDAAKEYATDNIAQGVAGYISSITGTQYIVTKPGSYLRPSRQVRETYPGSPVYMPKEHIMNIFKGDVRPIEIIGMLYGVNQLISDDDNLISVRSEFLFTYEDFSRAFYGDPELEDEARRSAYAQTIKQLEGEEDVDYNQDIDLTGTESSQDNALPPNYDAGVMADRVTISGDLDQMANQSIDILYGTKKASLPEKPLLENYLPDEQKNQDLRPSDVSAEVLEKYYADLSQWETVRDAGEEAAQSVRDIYKHQLEYKSIDCALTKIPTVGKYIPAGFTWAMRNGNSYVKNITYVSMVDNYLHDQDVLPSGVNLEPIYQYFESPNDSVRGNLSTLGRSGVLTTVDNILKDISPEIFGMSVQSGTAGAILAFVKTGNITDDVDGYKSLHNLYNDDWIKKKISGFADETLGLPTGTTYKTYTLYKSYQSYKTAVKIWSSADATVNLIDNNSALRAELDTSFGADVTEMQKSKLNSAKTKLTEIKAEIVSFLVTTIFSDEISKLEQKLGLPAGLGSATVGLLINCAFGLPITPIQIGILLVTAILGWSKTYVSCTADGYYPQMEDRPDANKWDVAGLGIFNGQSTSDVKDAYIKAAQYKANRLLGDVLEMPAVTGDEDLTVTQVMTGRWEDVYYWSPLVGPTICDKVGAPEPTNETGGVCGGGSRAGIWANPQTIMYTHIGF